MKENPFLPMARRFVEAIPHNNALGLKVVSMERARVTLRLEGKDALVGDTERGVYFPSVLLTLGDAACGVAFASALQTVGAVATLDLRIDYLRPVSTECALLAVAYCHRHTSDVGFLRCDIRAEDAEEPAAIVTASFMRTSRPPKEQS